MEAIIDRCRNRMDKPKQKTPEERVVIVSYDGQSIVKVDGVTRFSSSYVGALNAYRQARIDALRAQEESDGKG